MLVRLEILGARHHVDERSAVRIPDEQSPVPVDVASAFVECGLFHHTGPQDLAAVGLDVSLGLVGVARVGLATGAITVE